MRPAVGPAGGRRPDGVPAGMVSTPLAAVLRGAAAGAAGTTALNSVTYLDMVVRGRAASSTPEHTVETLAGKIGASIPGDEQTAGNRVSGLGPLLGILTGVGVGAGLGLLYAARRPPLLAGAALAAVGAMAGANAPVVGLGISDPRSWSASDWLADAVPHAAYGAVTAATLEVLGG